MGRDSLFKNEYIPMVERMAEIGLTDKEMAHVLGVTTVTFYNWSKNHPEFFNANARGKDHPNREVQSSLFDRATGRCVIIEEETDKDGNVVLRRKKTVPPDTTAALKWLFNRMPDQWREKILLEHKHDDDLTRMSEKAFQELAKEVLASFSENK